MIAKKTKRSTAGGRMATQGGVAEVSPRVWEHAIDRATVAGDLRGLLDLLLIPQVEPGPLNRLPDDPHLRERIIWALMKSPASRHADSIADAWTRAWAPGTKGRLNSVETGALALAREIGGASFAADVADALRLSERHARRVRAKGKR